MLLWPQNPLSGFCSLKSRLARAVALGAKILATRILFQETMDKRNIIRKVRLTPEEDALFKRKAARYKTVSAMVRDAVLTSGKILLNLVTV